MAKTKEELDDEFRDWVTDLEHVTSAPAWANVRDPARWLEEASLAELQHLVDRPGENGRRPEGGLLVLVAGTSPQPCLLSAMWRRPSRVLVAASDDGVGQDFAGRLEEALRALPSAPEVLPRVDFPSADPVAAFEKIRARLVAHHREHPEDRGRTTIDITGGKKPMVSAAFFLAAWRDIPAVYVDSDYDPAARMPPPCTAEMRELGNPGVALGLFAVREARRLWEAHTYQAADEMLAVAQRQRQEPKLGDARLIARGVLLWEELQYDRAVAEAPRKAVPEAVRYLADRWAAVRKSAREPRDWQGELRNRPWHLLLHLVDVVHWVRRRDRDHRARYLRLFAAGEVAIELALATGWQAGGITAPPGVTGSFSKAWPIIRAAEGGGSRLLATGELTDRTAGPWRTAALQEAAPWTEPELRDRRNAAAHGLAIVEPEHVEVLLGHVDALLLAVARQVGRARDHAGRDVDLSVAVGEWQRTDHSWFQPPAFPLPLEDA